MLILLPPSETKAEGGEGRFAARALSYPALIRPRAAVLDALVALSRDPAAAAAALHFGPQGLSLAARNRGLRRAPVRPAIERYTGVVYDGLDVPTLIPVGRAWVEGHVAIGSALFGLVGAADPIPAYRLSAGAALPGLPLRAHWAPAVSRVLRRTGEWVLDARSSAYTALGPAPVGAAVLAVESQGADGRRVALNHWNKLHKGRLVRALAESDAQVSSRDELLEWAGSTGVRLESRGATDVTLIVADGPVHLPAE